MKGTTPTCLNVYSNTIIHHFWIIHLLCLVEFQSYKTKLVLLFNCCESEREGHPEVNDSKVTVDDSARRLAFTEECITADP
jgi:hypothetical protein